MLLTITNTTTSTPATDLGFLLRKHPDRVHTATLSFGTAHVFYPEATAERCTAALLVEIDPIGLSRGHGEGRESAPLEPYVNDRPYVASSFASVAISRVFGTAMSGRCDERPGLADAPLRLEFRFPAVPCRGGEALVRSLFEPLGYEVQVESLPLDEAFPAWGASRHWRITLRAERRLADFLTHVYVLLPVLDDAKHYYVGHDELEKLLRHGEGWLATHPAKELITTRYLKRQRSLVRQALERLLSGEGSDEDARSTAHADEEADVERRIRLSDQRTGAVLAALRASGAATVLDLGCGEGRLIRSLLDDARFQRIAGLDASHRSLERARDRLRLDSMPDARRKRVELLHGALTYRDRRLEGFDAATLVEVIEHLDLPRLASLERAVFEFARPRTVIVTTPNVEYNVHFATLPAGRLRHRDHRFEWTRVEFRAWGDRVAAQFGYAVRYLPIGDEDDVTGAPTQMAIFVQASQQRAEGEGAT